jgi:2-iminobutanoate/2-iminopropanoate deaminase
LNMKLIAESEGATLRDAVRLVAYTTDIPHASPCLGRIRQA